MSNYSDSLAEFSQRYDLFDRFVRSVENHDGITTLTFDMYHCDDPERSEDDKDYILVLKFSSRATSQEDPISNSQDIIGGKVLEYALERDSLVIGIEWRLRANLGYTWSKLHFREPPVFINEEVHENKS